MNAENTKGRIEFIIDHIWWTFITLEIKDEKDRKNCKTISKCIRCGMGR